ncbi:UNVERIFIED_CONTAM: putative mitochondrial protein [Sesamum radiatum]|uniref:Mitochondrial protein n=1 Tax=Sesamum radiatum TaxID=300843 RepID=A0AAW2NT61_SESRA
MRLRQGDPLSLYLFLLCVEAFSGLLQQEEQAENIQGVAICRNSPAVSHLLFADDTLIFCQAMRDDVLCIRVILQTLEEVFGLKMNMGKVVIVFNKNTLERVQMELAVILGVPMVPKHNKYPPIVGQSKWAVFDSIKDRIWRKMQRNCHKLVTWL